MGKELNQAQETRFEQDTQLCQLTSDNAVLKEKLKSAATKMADL